MDDEGYDADDDVRASKFKISYFVDLNENGVEDPGERMGYKAARKHGYYMVATLMSYFVPNYDYSVTPGNPNDESWGYSGYFGYIDEIYGAMVDFYEDGTRVGDDDDTTGKNTYLSFYNANANYLQFGVTTDKPEENKKLPNGHPNPKAFTYYGTSSDMVALSNKIYNKNGERVKAPYIKTATPVQNSTMIIGETYKCEIVYDEDLVQIDGETIEAKVKIEKSSNTEYNNYSLTNFHFDGQRTITFDFKPSDLYADDSVYYTIDMMGLKGKDSKKRPMPASYFCAHKCSAYAYKSQGIDWNVYGKPTLMDDVNLDEMTDEQNADLAELLKHRMTLVTTTTKPSEEKAMKEFLNDPETVDKSTGKNLDVGGDVVKTETYNIRLTLCKMQKIKDGQAVRVMLGFPEGYGPEDAGVTFKAYHYIKDEHGNITGVEEIPCMVTELGLIIECRSFSPFTIAAVEGDVEENKTRTVLFQTSEGGDVYDVYNGENDENNKKSNKLVLDENDITTEIDRHISESVLTEDEKIFISYYMGFKNKYNPEGIKLDFNELCRKLNLTKASYWHKYTMTMKKLKSRKINILKPELLYINIYL